MTEDQRELTHEAMLAVTAGLAIQADKLTDAARDLASSTRQQAESFRFSRRLKAIIVFGLVGIGLLIVIAAGNFSNGAKIRSCTTPQGECYQRGQKSTASAVAQIVAEVNAHTDLVLLATLECTKPRQTNTELAACLRAKGI